MQRSVCEGDVNATLSVTEACKKIIKVLLRRYNEETKFSENFVSSLYLLIQSSTLKKCIEHCLTALATLLHVKVLLLNILF